MLKNFFTNEHDLPARGEMMVVTNLGGCTDVGDDGSERGVRLVDLGRP